MIDIRDLRDPQKHGEALFRLRKTERFKNRPLHEVSDAIDHADKVPGTLSLPAYARHIDLYPGDESMVTLTAATRQQELRDRAARGDKYAISMLAGIPFTEPSDGS